MPSLTVWHAVLATTEIASRKQIVPSSIIMSPLASPQPHILAELKRWLSSMAALRIAHGVALEASYPTTVPTNCTMNILLQASRVQATRFLTSVSIHFSKLWKVFNSKYQRKSYRTLPSATADSINTSIEWSNARATWMESLTRSEIPKACAHLLHPTYQIPGAWSSPTSIALS